MSQRDIVVLQSFLDPKADPDGNPFTALLAGSLPPNITVRYLSSAAYVRGRFDVLHTHWPELLIRSHPNQPALQRTLKTAVRTTLFAILLLRIQLRSRPVVRTVHNRQPHESGNPVERLLLRRLDRLTTHWIYLVDEPAERRHEPSTVIPHGSYIPWFAGTSVPDPEPGRLLCFGKLRAYKGVEDLLDAFTEAADPELTLAIAGKPESGELDAALRERAAGRPGIELELRRLSDAELAEQLGRAELVVLPYRDMYNSGALLLAASLNRPAVVPATPTNLALAEELGTGWITCYPPPIDAGRLSAAVASARTASRTARPDLSARDWDVLGRQLAAVYESVLDRTTHATEQRQR